jgi:hypothetical protein
MLRQVGVANSSATPSCDSLSGLSALRPAFRAPRKRRVMDAKERLVELFERERERALAAGLRVGVVTVLASRRLPCSEASLARICSCTHVGELTRWIGLAATAASEAAQS